MPTYGNARIDAAIAQAKSAAADDAAADDAAALRLTEELVAEILRLRRLLDRCHEHFALLKALGSAKFLIDLRTSKRITLARALEVEVARALELLEKPPAP